MRLNISFAVHGLGVLFVFFLGGAASAQQPAQAAERGRRSRSSRRQQSPFRANCHQLEHNSIVLTAHGAKNDANGSMCQACHGDASEHLKDPMKAKPDNPFGPGVPAQKQPRCA